MNIYNAKLEILVIFFDDQIFSCKLIHVRQDTDQMCPNRDESESLFAFKCYDKAVSGRSNVMNSVVTHVVTKYSKQGCRLIFNCGNFHPSDVV